MRFWVVMALISRIERGFTPENSEEDLCVLWGETVFRRQQDDRRAASLRTP
jgi:hypothetical protein